MADIVSKLQSAPSLSVGTPSPRPVGSIDADFDFRVRASTLDGQQKRAEVWAEANGQRTSSVWAMLCDEGTRLGGSDSAPSPLTYFSAAIAFWLLTQLSRCAELTRIHFRQAGVEQTLRVMRRGSILQGTIQAGCSGLEVRIAIDSDEPPERIQRLVHLARDSCFTHGALVEPVPLTASITLNGEALSVD
jgi:uncharacterized OsmC-like protein